MEFNFEVPASTAVPVSATPQAFGALIAREIPRWAEVVKAGNVRPD